MITAQRIADRLCQPTSHDDGDFELHRGFVGQAVADGYEWAAAITNDYEPGAPIRLLPHGGDWPYWFRCAADAERALIEYCEGDIAVRIYATDAAYEAALDAYLRGPES